MIKQRKKILIISTLLLIIAGLLFMSGCNETGSEYTEVLLNENLSDSMHNFINVAKDQGWDVGERGFLKNNENEYSPAINYDLTDGDTLFAFNEIYCDNEDAKQTYEIYESTETDEGYIIVDNKETTYKDWNIVSQITKQDGKSDSAELWIACLRDNQLVTFNAPRYTQEVENVSKRLLDAL